MTRYEIGRGRTFLVPCHGLRDHFFGRLGHRHTRQDAAMTWLMPAELVPVAGVRALGFAWSCIYRPTSPARLSLDILAITLVVATVKNEGKIPAPLSIAGIRLERTGELMELPGDNVADVDQPLTFLFTVPSRQAFDINIEPVLIKRMLGVLEAQPDDEFTAGRGADRSAVFLPTNEGFGLSRRRQDVPGCEEI